MHSQDSSTAFLLIQPATHYVSLVALMDYVFIPTNVSALRGTQQHQTQHRVYRIANLNARMVNALVQIRASATLASNYTQTKTFVIQSVILDASMDYVEFPENAYV